MKKLVLGLLLLTSSTMVFAEASIQDMMEAHLKKYAEKEHFSAIQVSVKAGGELKNYAVGTRAIGLNSPKLSTSDLFNVGSITKSFTAALAVLAETEGKLRLNNKLGDYLSQYPHWANMTLTGLLNMSTGIPNYSDTPKINYLMSQNLKQYLSQADLIDLVYSRQYNPPLKPGYFYSNTGYVLMDLILSKQYNLPFKQLLTDKILKPLALKNTFYPLPEYSKEELNRLTHGYSYNVYENPGLLGQNVTENNLSWAGAAGALIANSEDVVHWVEDLFINDRLLTAAQKKQMQRMISLNTGKSIEKTDAKNPHGFGLGIVQAFDNEMGHFWYYEGETLGFRALYMYVPCNQVIAVALFNSATNSENDHSGELLKAIYQHTLAGNKALKCQQE